MPQTKRQPLPTYPADLINQLGTIPPGMGPSDLAKRNTALLTQWSGIPRSGLKMDPDSYQARLKDPKWSDLLRDNPSYVERTTQEYIKRNAQDYIPFFRGLSRIERDRVHKELEKQLNQMYPRGYHDQDELTPEGKVYWDALRAIAHARDMAN